MHSPYSVKYQPICVSHGRHVYMRNIQYRLNMGDPWDYMATPWLAKYGELWGMHAFPCAAHMVPRFKNPHGPFMVYKYAYPYFNYMVFPCQAHMVSIWGMYYLTMHSPYSTMHQPIWVIYGGHIFMRNIQCWLNMGDPWGIYG